MHDLTEEQLRQMFDEIGEKQEKLSPLSESQSDTVRVIDPKGILRSIPKNQLDNALKAGGKLEQ